MPFDFDATGIPDEGQKTFEKKILPKQWFLYEIIDFTAKDGRRYPLATKTKDGKFNKVDALVEVKTPGEFLGERLFHSVTFKPAITDGKPTPGAGMSKHFLKTIGQPYEDNVKVNESDWVGSEFDGYTVPDEYNGRNGNKIAQVRSPTKDDSLPF